MAWQVGVRIFWLFCFLRSVYYSYIYSHYQYIFDKGSLVEKLPSYGDLKMKRIQQSNSSVKLQLSKENVQ